MKKSFLLILSILALVGCNPQSSADIGQSAPKIAAKQLDGRTLAPHVMQGKAVVLAFFKNGCASCLKDLLKLNAMAKEQQDKLVVLAINALDSPETIADMAQRFGWDSMILLKDELGITSKRYDVAVTPTLIIFDKNGIIQARVVGERPWEGTQRIFDAIL